MKEKEVTYIDHLIEDNPINGQKWVCISFLSPEGIMNCSVRGLKVRGVYDTREEADKRAENLQKIDPDFDVFVGEVGKWLPWDPDPNEAEDQVYREKQLNDLAKGYKENLEKAKNMQQQRKTDMIQKAARDEQSKNKVQDRLRKKLEERNRQKRMENIASRQISYSPEENNKKKRGKRKKKKVPLEKEYEVMDKKFEMQDEIAKQEGAKLQETQKQINEKSQKVETIDDQLTKIQQLYEKLHKKQNDETQPVAK